jgi:hypothetical protein
MTLYLECTPDELVARMLGVPRRCIDHTGDKGRVCHHLSRKENVIGLIDEDPGSAVPSYLKSLVVVSKQDDLRVLEDPQSGNRLIILCPRLEDWLVRTAQQGGLQMRDFGLSERPRDLHGEINHRLEGLRRLLESLLEAKSARLLRLRGLLIGSTAQTTD